jgi:osmotically-inducible protein OsmY
MGREEQRSFGQYRADPETYYGGDDPGYRQDRQRGYGSAGYGGEGGYGGADQRYGGGQGYGGGMGGSRSQPYGGQGYGGQNYGGQTYGGQGFSEGYGGGMSGQGGGGRSFGGWDRGQQGHAQQGYSQQGYGSSGGQGGALGGGDNSAIQRMSDGEHRGRGPKNYSRADDRIRDDVNDRFTDDPWLDASEIEVTVTTAEVTLTGTVDSRDDKRRAEDIAEQVSGVKNVQNNLRVQPSGETGSAGQRMTGQGGQSGQQAGHNGHGAQATGHSDQGRSASSRQT